MLAVHAAAPIVCVTIPHAVCPHYHILQQALPHPTLPHPCHLCGLSHGPPAAAPPAGGSQTCASAVVAMLRI